MCEARGMDPDLIDDGSTEQSGFDDDDEFPTETPGADDADDEPEQQVEAQPVAQTRQWTQAEYDEWVATKAQIQELRGTLEKSNGTAFGKIGGLERKLNELASSPKIDIAQADIDALKEDFPPMAAVLEKVRSMQVIHGGIDAAKIEEMVQARVAPALDAIGTTVEQTVEKRMLSREHPDWQQVTATPEFAAWTGTLKPADQKMLADTWDADYIGAVITAFKSRNKASPTRKSRADAAVTPRGSGVAHTAVMSDEKSGFDAA